VTEVAEAAGITDEQLDDLFEAASNSYETQGEV
jgi:hypothetical protein